MSFPSQTTISRKQVSQILQVTATGRVIMSNTVIQSDKGNLISAVGMSSSIHGHRYGVYKDNWGESFFAKRDDGKYLVAFYDIAISPTNEYSCSTIEIEYKPRLEGANQDTNSSNATPLQSPTTSPQDFENVPFSGGTSPTNDFQQHLRQLAPGLLGRHAALMRVMTADQFATYRRQFDNRALAARLMMSDSGERRASFVPESVNDQFYMYSGDLIEDLVKDGFFSSALVANWSRPMERLPRLVCFACGLEVMDMSCRPKEQHSTEKSCYLSRMAQRSLTLVGPPSLAMP